MRGLFSATGSTGLCLAVSILSLMLTLMLFPTRLRRHAWLLALSLSLLVLSDSVWGLEPKAALPYKSYLIQQARIVWGPDAPVMLFAGQIHQESGWNPEARSAYACGITQFTPETAAWIAEQYRVDVGRGECTDARWGIRAMLRYDKYLSERVGKSKDDCSNRRFMLSAYNGGFGWVVRDRVKALDAGADATDYDAVAPFNSGRASGFFTENRQYPPKIVGHQRHYEAWGGPITCKAKETVNVARLEVVVPSKLVDDRWRCAGVDRWLCRMAPLRNSAPAGNQPQGRRG